MTHTNLVSTNDSISEMPCSQSDARFSERLTHVDGSIKYVRVFQSNRDMVLAEVLETLKDEELVEESSYFEALTNSSTLSTWIT